MIFSNLIQFLGLIIVTVLFLCTLDLNFTIWRDLQHMRRTDKGNDYLYHRNSSTAAAATAIHLNINTGQETTRSILLAVGVLNRISLKQRRDVIRLTWMKLCKDERYRSKARCYFFTDSYKDLNKSDADRILEENEQYNDMLFMPIKGGHSFGKRIIWMLQWYVANFHFQYFLRVDDDYFLCFDRLVNELQFRPRDGLYWGYTHCTDNVIRVDEGWMLLSRDIVDESLSKLNTTLLCHPFGDQTVALWLKYTKLKITWFPDNGRIVHQATAYNEHKYMIPNFCQLYMAMHGSYSIQMLKYWILSREYSSDREHRKYHVPAIPEFTSVCKKNRTFDLNAFWPHVRFEAKLCKNDPEWPISNMKFIGREEAGKEAIF